MTAFPLCNSLNWQLFAEDAGSELGVTEANAQPQAEVSPNGPEDFEKLIKGPYKQAYDARVKSILQQRLKNSRETAEKYAAAQPVLELMRQRLGIEGEDYGAMEQALRERLPEAPPVGQQRQVAEFEKLERRLLPPDMDYSHIQGLRLEAREKLDALRPLNVGQAGRISGVSPADVAALMIWLQAHDKEDRDNG